MLSVTKSNSSLFLLLLSFTFFSCEQLIEIIKPHLPKHNKQTCRLEVERYKDELIINHYYDSLGRLSTTVFTDLTGAPDTTRYITYYTYNERNQLIRQYEPDVMDSGFDKRISYDASGRISRTETVLFTSFCNRQLEEYSYSADTVVVNTTITRPWGELVSTSEKMYVFAGENLVKIRYADSTGSYAGAEDTFSYTTMLNKRSKVDKTLDFLAGSPRNGRGIPMNSKYLPSRWVDRGGNVTTFSWELNEQGYVTRQTQTHPSFTSIWNYEYSCELQ